MSNEHHPLLIIVSAPSGTGKTTLCQRLLRARDDLVYSVSCTTRAPRGREKEGVDYFFMDENEFMRRVQEGAFLEYARVHGNYYGTLRKTVTAAMESGQSVLMDIDVQGAEQVRNSVSGLSADHLLRRGFLDIFIAPPSLDVLRERLVQRGEDTTEVIDKRISNAARELAESDKYQYTIVNDDLENAHARLLTTVEREYEQRK